jgi:hypothetical protein
MERPDLSSEKSSVVAKAYPKNGLGTMSPIEIQAIASTAYDPMRGRYAKEGSIQAQQILAAHNKRLLKASSKSKPLQVGERVYHTERKIYGIIAASSLDGKRVEVAFGHERKLVQLRNLSRV